MPERRFVMFRGHAFLGGRAVAHAVRKEALRFLAEHPDGAVVLDFSGVRGVSHSFADELLSPFSEELGQAVPNRVRIENASPGVVEMLRLVADMHDLVMPQVGPGVPEAA